MQYQPKKRILVAPLNWGLGHATRCIPLIRALLTNNFEVVIASDGIALKLLQKEFPKLESIELPSYNISYAKNGQFFKLKMLQNSPKLIQAIKAEKKATKTIIKDYRIDGILSDNRLGVHSKLIPCVFMTHQLKVLSGNTTWLSTKMHQKIIKRFDECWVPDTIGLDNLSGKLGHTDVFDIPIKYIGPLSRFKKTDCKIKYDLMVLLSGPEPQRTLLQDLLLKELNTYKRKVLFVKGIVDGEQKPSIKDHITSYNFMTSEALEHAINESDIVLSRSGYTTVMDLAKLEKKAFFIPTPGQFEQEYLAERLTKLGYVPSCKQKEFKIEMLNSIEGFSGIKTTNYNTNYKKLFRLFKGK
ncbi:glycosyltransferase [Psychroserpens ponticola]|uniref:Glycosyltransferase n=1 Tax=Psychroserpens ponticola TaxID=2932268 RepID=A0ABY7S0C4_9FLAO|nr:glycosyltransferase [Psychroserpens ponticola]WCO01380.1 glycosyltransferase [Psychroserpens ponticola]